MIHVETSPTLSATDLWGKALRCCAERLLVLRRCGTLDSD
jgi:hypothetical protein